MLFLAGVYVGEAGSSMRFRWVKALTSTEITQLTHTVAHRLACSRAVKLNFFTEFSDNYNHFSRFSRNIPKCTKKWQILAIINAVVGAPTAQNKIEKIID
jgi:hypothetical protein